MEELLDWINKMEVEMELILKKLDELQERYSSD